jgi:hypothetical protein
MRYRMSPSGADRTDLVFSMPEKPLLIVFLAVLAALCIILGLAYALSEDNPGEPAAAAGFLGFGLFCLCGIFFLSTAIPYPARLVFDNARGWLSVRDRRGALQGAVPYDGLGGVSVLRSVSEGIARYSAGLDLQRGGRWELYASRREGKARAYRDGLAGKLRLTAPVLEPPGPAPGPRPERTPDGGERYRWRLRPRPLPLIVSLCAVFAFAGALAGMRAFSHGVVAYAVALAFAALLVVVTVGSLLRAAGERHEVTIGGGSVSYTRSSSFGRGKSFRVALSGVAAVDLSFSFARVETAVTLLSPQDVDLFARYRQGTFSPSETVGILRFLRGLHRIDVSALLPGERLGLAEAIRESLTSPHPRG